MSSRSRYVVVVLFVVVCSNSEATLAGQGSVSPSGSTMPWWGASIVETTRVESWRFFEPAPLAGDPDYELLASRLRLEVRARWSQARLTVALQHVGFLGLPEAAFGPGPLGTGALYYAQGGSRTNPQQLYLRYAQLQLPTLGPGIDVQIGRMAYATGSEAPTGVPKLEQVKGSRLAGRLLGEFEWSIYQRGYDGARVDITRPNWRATGIAFLPTQGGFARVAGPTMTDVVVAGATLSTRPNPRSSHPTQVQAFGLYYADHRAVTERPDNTGLSATAADVDISTFGGVLAGAYRTGPGEFDLFGWSAVQQGDWYGQAHRAFALAGEAGYQWGAAHWRPWVRAGVFHGSGDGNRGDARHETFFPMLPTVRKFAQTTIYSTMNLRDVFGEVRAQPTAALGVRLEVHRLRLASSEDRWYGGSGATLGRGSAFGYAGRPSNGQRELGTSVELSASHAIRPAWSINGFVARMSAGPVVSGTFAGDRAWFAYVESVLSLDFGR